MHNLCIIYEKKVANVSDDAIRKHVYNPYFSLCQIHQREKSSKREIIYPPFWRLPILKSNLGETASLFPLQMLLLPKEALTPLFQKWH